MALKILIEPHFFPNLQYLTKFLSNSLVIIDDLSLFGKQSYRNRAYIVSANKVLMLTIPLKQGKTKSPMKDVQIDYSTNWTRGCWNSICSGYGKSPYFGFYAGKIEEIIKRKYTYLIDLDLPTIDASMEILGLKKNYCLRSEYSGNWEEVEDWRSKIHPKKTFEEDKEFYPKPYLQAFQERFGFIPNLSVLDLIFNEGPQGKTILQQSIVK